MKTSTTEPKVGDLVRCFYTKTEGVVVRVEPKRAHTEFWVLWSDTGKTLCEDGDNLVKVNTAKVEE